MTEMTGGELLLRCLHAEGVRHIHAITDGTYMMVIEALERLRLEGCRLVMIDTPPAINMAIQRVINVADLVVIPTRPSPHDLRAVAVGEHLQVREIGGVIAQQLLGADLQALVDQVVDQDVEKRHNNN